MKTAGRVAILLVAILAIAVLAGCDMYTAKTVKILDDNAAYSRCIADGAAFGNLTPADQAYYLECFARTFQNLSDAGHGQQPTFKGVPTNRPATLPWKPEGGENSEPTQ